MIEKKRIMSFAILALIIGFTTSVIPSAAILPKTFSAYFEEWVPMRDGVRLHTFVYLPNAEIWGIGPYPAIVQRTPYGIGEAGVLPGPDRPPANEPTSAVLRGWEEGVAHGYAVVFQDMRGRFASEGVDRLFYDDGPDGYDTIEWVAAQPWCNGNVGIAGSSACGITSYLAGGQKPPHLKAIFAQAGSGDLYNDFVFEGDAIELETSLMWVAGQVPGISLSHIIQYVLPNLPPGKSLSDVFTEFMTIINDLMSHLSLESPYRPVDSEWWMHLPLHDYPALTVLEPFFKEVLSHPTQDDFRDYLNTKNTIDVPTIHVSSWYDCFSRGVLEPFMAIQERVGNQKLFMGPGPHYNVYLPNFLPYDPFFKWFDYWLRGIDNGIMDEPPVWYYCMGAEEWRYADQWPPSGIQSTTYYLHSDGVLSTYSPHDEEAPTSYIYDPHDPVPTMGGKNLIIPAGSFDQRLVEPPYRDDVLLYTSNVLEKDTEVTGHVEVILHASSNCTDTDFTAKLIDVYPDGSTMLIFDGVTRARYRQSARYEVLMEPGTTYEFTIDLGDISQVFKAGHRIQVDVSSSNFPRRDRNFNTGGQLYNETEMFVAENTIYHDAEHCSYIVLPVMSPKPKVFEGTAEIDTKELAYEGPAELYTLEKAVYLHFDDKWVKWEIICHWQLKSVDVEFYRCKGNLGTLVVAVHIEEPTSYAWAVGHKVFFYGSASYS